ncbi:MAG: NAD-dependent epimerase/dehydratase family protein [Promethearchaeota archaeon]
MSNNSNSKDDAPKILITGATGQLGAQLVKLISETKALGLKDTKDIICFIRSPRKAKKLKKYGVSFKFGTLDDVKAINQIFSDKNIKFVFHIAANANPESSFEDFYRVNYLGTKNMIKAFIESEAEIFVYASSIAVYDTFMSNSNKDVIVVDENTPRGPLKGEGYSVSKRMTERLIEIYQKKHPEKKFIITRIGPIIGPGDRIILPSFVKFISWRWVPKLISKGSDFFSITPAYDIARAQVFLAEYFSDGSNHSLENKDKNIDIDDNPLKRDDWSLPKIFNIAGPRLRYRDVYDIISEFYHWPPPIVSIPYTLFKIMKPLLFWIKRLFPNNELFQKAFSDAALGYIGKSYIYKSDRLSKLGFKWSLTPRQTIIEGLKDLVKNPEFGIDMLKKRPFTIKSGSDFISHEILSVLESFGPLPKDIVKIKKTLKARIKIWLKYLLFFGAITFLFLLGLKII